VPSVQDRLTTHVQTIQRAATVAHRKPGRERQRPTTRNPVLLRPGYAPADVRRESDAPAGEPFSLLAFLVGTVVPGVGFEPFTATVALDFRHLWINPGSPSSGGHCSQSTDSS